MRRWLWIVGIIFVLALCYWAWPLVGALQLASAAQHGDSQGVMDRTDLPALRRSLARQIAVAYLNATGKADKMGALGRSMAGAAATTVADPYVAAFLTPENITALLSQGKLGSVTVDGKPIAVDAPVPQIDSVLREDIWSVLLDSGFDGIASFRIGVPDPAGGPDAYGIHMRLQGLTWRLSGVDLPPGVIDEIARGLLAHNTAGP